MSNTDHLSPAGLKSLEDMVKTIKGLDDNISTDKETRLATGLDAANKLTFTDKGELIETFLKAYGIIMDYGANKYDYANFEKAPYVYEDVLDCLMRHWIAFCGRGEDIDPESKQLHIGHIVARCAIAVMKAERLKYKDNPQATRFIGWDAKEVEELCKVMPDKTFLEKLFSPIKAKDIPYAAHVSSEMIEAVIQSPFFTIKDKYSFRSWCKTFELLLISFIVSSINGETDAAKAEHAKVLLWVAINIYYFESEAKSADHIGYINFLE